MDGLREKYIAAIAAAQDESALEETRLAAVGKKGEVSLKLRELGKMTPEERQVAGPALNALKEELNSALMARKAALADAALDERLRTEWLDVTLPARDQRRVTPIIVRHVTPIPADLVAMCLPQHRIDIRVWHLMCQFRQFDVAVLGQRLLKRFRIGKEIEIENLLLDHVFSLSSPCLRRQRN